MDKRNHRQPPSSCNQSSREIFTEDSSRKPFKNTFLHNIQNQLLITQVIAALNKEGYSFHEH